MVTKNHSWLDVRRSQLFGFWQISKENIIKLVFIIFLSIYYWFTLSLLSLIGRLFFCLSVHPRCLWTVCPCFLRKYTVYTIQPIWIRIYTGEQRSVGQIKLYWIYLKRLFECIALLAKEIHTNLLKLLTYIFICIKSTAESHVIK